MPDEEPSWLDNLSQLSHRFFGGPVLESNKNDEETATEETKVFVVEEEEEKDTSPATPTMPLPIANAVPMLPSTPPSREPQLAPRESEARIFLKRHPETRRLGLHFENTPSGSVVITSVDKGYSAEGKVFVGDRILGVNGTRLEKNGQYQAVDLIAACQDELVGLIVSDDSRTVTISRNAAKEKIGIDLEACNFPRPVRVTTVQPGSYADLAGLQVGDMIVSVNGSRTCDRDQLARIIATTPQATLNMKVRYVAPENATGGKPGSPSIVTKMVRSLSFSKRSRKPEKEANDGSGTNRASDGSGTNRSNGSTGEPQPTGVNFQAPLMVQQTM